MIDFVENFDHEPDEFVSQHLLRTQQGSDLCFVPSSSGASSVLIRLGWPSFCAKASCMYLFNGIELYHTQCGKISGTMGRMRMRLVCICKLSWDWIIQNRCQLVEAVYSNIDQIHTWPIEREKEPLPKHEATSYGAFIPFPSFFCI